MSILRSPALLDNAFKEVLLIKGDIVNEITKAIYNDIAPCYELTEDFNKQCARVLNKIKQFCDANGIVIPINSTDLAIPEDERKILYTDVLLLRLQTKRYENQTNLFYITIKKYLENIYISLISDSIAFPLKKEVLNELLPQLIMCGPGIFTDLGDALAKLNSNSTLDQLLAELRKNVVLELSAKHAHRNQVAKGDVIHVDNVFLNYAQEQGLNPLGGHDIVNMNETYIKNAKVMKNDLENFLVDFFLAYQPDQIVKFLVQKLQNNYDKLVENINTDSLLGLKDNLLNIELKGTFPRLEEIIKSKKFGFNAQELFKDIPENFTQLKLRSLLGCVIKKCIDQEIFKNIKINCNEAEISYIPCEPPIVLIDGCYGDEAIKYFFEKKLWINLSLEDVKYLNINFDEEMLDYYLSQGYVYFKNVNLSGLQRLAIHNKDLNQFKILLYIGADTNQVIHEKKNSIEFAATQGAWEIVRLIAQKKRTDNTDRAHYGHALLKAAFANESETVQSLINAGAPITWHYPDTGFSPLHCAVKHRNIAMVKCLIEANADLTKENNEKLTPIVLAASQGAWEVVREIAQKRTDNRDRAYYGHALLRAAFANESETVQSLINAGAPTTWHYPDTGFSPLHCAINNKNLAMVKCLLEANADLTRENNEKLTPIVLAASQGAWEIVRLIAEKRTDNIARAHYGNALLRAAFANESETVQSLINAGAPTTWYYPDTGFSPLHCAIKNKNIAMVKCLLEANADLLKKDLNGLTPIKFATQIGALDIVKLIADQTSIKSKMAKFFFKKGENKLSGANNQSHQPSI